MTTNAMDTLLALKCRACGGTKEIQVHVSRDINSPTQPQPCCGCLNLDDIPTGLLVPELVEQCSSVAWVQAHGLTCNCQGTGFVPVSEDTALRVLLEWLAETWCMNISCMDGTWFVILEVGDQCQVPTMGATPLEALAAAIKASVEANHATETTPGDQPVAEGR